MSGMTELDQVRAMLRRSNIEFVERKGVHDVDDNEPVIVVDIERGYAGFHVMMEFSLATGLLIDVGAFE